MTTLLLTIPEAAAQLRISPSTLRNPAKRAQLGLDLATVKMGRRTLMSYDVLREILREIAGADAPVRQPTTRRAVI